MRTAVNAPVLVLFVLPSLAVAQQNGSQTIAVPAGPLNAIYVGNEGSVQIDRLGSMTSGQIYPPTTRPGDYGTFIAVGGVLYAPNFMAHGGTATGGLGAYTPFTPVSQSAVTGNGGNMTPYRVVTVYDVGSTGLQVTETNDYVAGQESFLTTLVLTNHSQTSIDGLLYRAADCYLSGSDSGYGFEDAAHFSVGCSVNPNNMPSGLVEQWLPITPGNAYFHSNYADVWAWIGSQRPFPNTCRCTTQIDNGAGISWPFNVSPNGSQTFSHVTTFSPVGTTPIRTEVTADRPSAIIGSANGYTVRISNPNREDIALSNLVSQLADGFIFISGSTSGVFTSDPTITGQMLDFGPLDMPAMSNRMFHFRVNVATTPGNYFNTVSGMATGGFTVSPASNAAPISVVDLTQRADAAVLEDAALVRPDTGVVDAGRRDATSGDSGSPDAVTTARDGSIATDTSEPGDVGEDTDDAGESTSDSGLDAGLKREGEGCGCTTAAWNDALPSALVATGLLFFFSRRRR